MYFSWNAYRFLGDGNDGDSRNLRKYQRIKLLCMTIQGVSVFPLRDEETLGRKEAVRYCEEGSPSEKGLRHYPEVSTKGQETANCVL